MAKTFATGFTFIRFFPSVNSLMSFQVSCIAKKPDTLSQIETGNSGMEVKQSVITKKHSCWVCQEEMGSEALLQHYENHMSHVAKDGS